MTNTILSDYLAQIKSYNAHTMSVLADLEVNKNWESSLLELERRTVGILNIMSDLESQVVPRNNPIMNEIIAEFEKQKGLSTSLQSKIKQLQSGIKGDLVQANQVKAKIQPSALSHSSNNSLHYTKA